MSTTQVPALSAVPGGAPPRAVDMVFTFTFETYGDAVARGMNRPPERLLTGLRGSDRIGKLLVANPFRSAPVRWVRTAIGKADAPFPADADNSLVTPLRWRRSDPTDVPKVRGVYRDFDRKVRATAELRGLQSPAVITANPLMAGFCPFDWADPITFYARDDWAELPAKQAYWPAIRASYRALRSSDRAVVAVSQQILDRIEPSGPSAVVPNGVEPSEWTGPVPPEPAWLAGVPHPRAVYVGTLDSRLDVTAMVELARRRPDLQQVLVGVTTEPDWIAPLVDLPNVHIHGHVGRSDLVALIRNCEIAMVSHRRTALTEAMSPLKIYEYLAAGCPVLSIDLPPCRGISPRVILSESVSDFADLVDSALAMGMATEEERLGFISENSWAARHEQILAIALRGRGGA
jgi:teichuronic acid biosynthesis glycosyltransferase TuaH